MNDYSTENIRNVAIVGHGSTGKTTLVEAILHNFGVTSRMGRIEDGTTASDYDDEEKKRKMSISTSLVVVEEGGVKINLLDTPGFADYVGEVKAALQVADAAIIVVDAVSGVEVGTEIVWQYCDELNLPRMIVINKMDRENANYKQALESVQALDPNRKLVPVEVAVGEKANFKGVIGLLSLEALMGASHEGQPYPPELKEEVEAARLRFVEAAAEGEDELTMKYLEGEELTREEIMHGFKMAINRGSFAPVLMTAATSEIGIYPLVLAIRRYLPSPADRPARVADDGKGGEVSIATDPNGPLSVFAFKTLADPFVGRMTFFRVMSGTLLPDSRLWNHTRGNEERFGTVYTMRGKEQISVAKLAAGDIGMVTKLSTTLTGDSLGDREQGWLLPPTVYPGRLFSVAITPHSQADQAKMGTTLTRLCEEDPTLHWHNDPTTKETILEGMGDQHIEVALSKAAARFGTSLDSHIPRVAYRETITKVASDMYRHKKQTGGAGQFGEVHMRVEPLTDSSEMQFTSEVFGGAISSSYFPAIEKGVRSVMSEGVIAGYPLEALKVIITDGKEHAVDSKPIAFETAGREAFKLAVAKAGPRLLEPIMLLKIIVPEANMGDILSDLNTRRARVMGIDQEGRKSVITAEVPLAEVQRYVTDLRSMTAGRGVFSMEYVRHDLVPAHIQEQVVSEAKKAREAAGH